MYISKCALAYFKIVIAEKYANKVDQFFKEEPAKNPSLIESEIP